MYDPYEILGVVRKKIRVLENQTDNVDKILSELDKVLLHLHTEFEDCFRLFDEAAENSNSVDEVEELLFLLDNVESIHKDKEKDFNKMSERLKLSESSREDVYEYIKKLERSKWIV